MSDIISSISTRYDNDNDNDNCSDSDSDSDNSQYDHLEVVLFLHFSF